MENNFANAMDDDGVAELYNAAVNHNATKQREEQGDVPQDGVPFTEALHSFARPRLLTEEDPLADNPPGFRGELYLPQRTLLAAMLALERTRTLKVKVGDERVYGGSRTLQVNYARIAAKFSFGKTVLAIALVCASRTPRPLPEVLPIAMCPSANTNIVKDQNMRKNIGYLPVITARYSRFMPVTVVVAAAHVIAQWEENARRFTDLRCFTIEHVRDLREFEKIYRRGGLAEYDLVFIKAGRVTTNFVVEGEPPVLQRDGKAPPANRSLMSAIGRVLDGVPVGRLIIDDYDTLKLSPDDCFIPALFTWVVSATRRRAAAVAGITLTGRVERYFRENLSDKFPITGAAGDDVLNQLSSLQCCDRYVDGHINTTTVGFRRIVVRGGVAGEILRDLEVVEDVVEMVNGDAVATASQRLGIDAPTIGAVIQGVVGGQLSKLRHALRTLARVAAARAALRAKPGAEHDRQKIIDLREALKNGTDEKSDEALGTVAGYSIEVGNALESLEAWATETREKHSKTLGRMRDNIREKCCQCCMVPFEAGEPAYVLVGCCQLIICQTCVTRSQGGHRTFIHRCPNCAVDINVRTGVIRVGSDIDLEAALKDEEVIGSAEDIAPDEAPEKNTNDYAGLNPKLKALVQFIRGEAVDCLAEGTAPCPIHGLLDGRRDAPWPADKPRKLLVFTVHPESTAEIGAVLERFRIPHSQLAGTRPQKLEACRRIADGEVSVMLVNSPKDAGGLHLPFLSHIVFYHNVIDKNVEAQVAARGQRLGREHNLEIVSIVNQSEAASIGIIVGGE